MPTRTLDDGVLGVAKAGVGQDYVEMLEAAYELLRAYSAEHGHPQDLRGSETLEDHDDRLKAELAQLLRDAHRKVGNTRPGVLEDVVQSAFILHDRIKADKPPNGDVDRFLNQILNQYRTMLTILYPGSDLGQRPAAANGGQSNNTAL